MSRTLTRPRRTRNLVVGGAVLALLTFVLVARSYPADAATTSGFATSWTVYTNPVDFFPVWVDPTNPTNPLGVSDVVCESSNVVTNDFEFGFGAFPIPPGDTITGIEVIIDASIQADPTVDVTLTDGAGTNASDTKQFDPPLGGSCTDAIDNTLGGSADDWNTTLTQADFAAGDFGVRIFGGLFMDSIQIVVHHEPATEIDGFATAWTIINGDPAAEYTPPYPNTRPLGASDDACQDSSFNTNVFELTFGAFTVPGGFEIKGVEVTIDAGMAAGDSPDVTLTDGAGTDESDTKNLTPPSAGSCSATSNSVLGGPTDDWNTTLTAADFTNGDFGVKIAGAIFMDSINLKIYVGAPDTPPTADANGPYNGNEGSPIALDGSGSTDDNGITNYEWDCTNNGSFDTSSPNPGDSTCTYGDNGAFTVNLRVTDTIAQQDTDTASVTVVNVPPTVDVPTVVHNGGMSVTASATFTDPATNDAPFTCTVDYGEGSGPQPGAVLGNTCTGPPQDLSEGFYTIEVAVTDKDGDTGTNSLLYEVRYCRGVFATHIGTNGDDSLAGTTGDDVIVGKAGNDTILGLDGNDLICAGSGDDLVYGGAGNDEVYGEHGEDELNGGGGDDRLIGGDNADVLNGGIGNDELLGQGGPDQLNGGAGDDTLKGGDAPDVLDGGPGTDVLNGGDGADTCINGESLFSC